MTFDEASGYFFAVAIAIAVLVIFSCICFAGDPDLLDAIIHCLMKG